MNHCRIIDVNKIVTTNATEPVSLNEAKAWLKVTFVDDDSLITQLIKEAREEIEDFCCISLVEQQVEIIVDLKAPNNRECIEFELPFGPCNDFNAGVPDVSVEIWDGDSWIDADTDNYQFIGSNFIYFKSNLDGKYKFVYNTRYSSIPNSAKAATLINIADKYEHRGDEVRPGLSEMAKKKAQPLKRFSWL